MDKFEYFYEQSMFDFQTDISTRLAARNFGSTTRFEMSVLGNNSYPILLPLLCFSSVQASRCQSDVNQQPRGFGNRDRYGIARFERTRSR